MPETAGQKIFITAYSNAEAEKVASNLLRVYQQSNHLHALVNTPQAADLILVGGIGNEMSQWDYLRHSMHHPIIESFPEKAFTVSYRDTPVLFNRGVYESALVSPWTRGRCVTGCYKLSGHHNPAIQADASPAKDLLFSFTGRMSHPVRRQLMAMQFKRRDVLLEDTSTFNYWNCSPTVRQQREQHFGRILSRSKFALCPRGVGAGSIRLFEAMQAGVAPVLLADKWIWPSGIPWQQFSIHLPESNLHRLEEVVTKREQDFAAMGALARSYWERCFADSNYFNHIVERCITIREQQRLPEAFYWSMRHPYMLLKRVAAKTRSLTQQQASAA